MLNEVEDADLWVNLLPFASFCILLHPFAMLHATLVRGAQTISIRRQFCFFKPERQRCTFSSQSNGQPSFDRRCREPRRSCLGLDLNGIRVLDDGRAWLLLWWPGA